MIKEVQVVLGFFLFLFIRGKYKYIYKDQFRILLFLVKDYLKIYKELMLYDYLNKD